MKCRTLLVVILAVVVGTRALPANPPEKKEPEKVQEKGVVLFDFYGLKMPKDEKDAKDITKVGGLRHKVGTDFLTWRKQEPKTEQWIEYWAENVALPGDKNESFLLVYYSVPGKDKANGVAFKLYGKNYSAYEGGDLVIRMCQCPKLTKDRGGDLPTDALTYELKTSDAKGKALPASQLELTFGNVEKGQAQHSGSFDFRIPLRDFGDENGKIDLTRLDEIGFTFNNRAIPEEMRRGVIGIQAIVLTPERTKVTDNTSATAARKQVDAILDAHRNKKGE